MTRHVPALRGLAGYAGATLLQRTTDTGVGVRVFSDCQLREAAACLAELDAT